MSFRGTYAGCDERFKGLTARIEYLTQDQEENLVWAEFDTGPLWMTFGLTFTECDWEIIDDEEYNRDADG